MAGKCGETGADDQQQGAQLEDSENVADPYPSFWR